MALDCWSDYACNMCRIFFFQAEDGIRDLTVTGVQRVLFRSNGGAADAAIVYVNTDPAKGEKGITAVVVEKGTQGFKVGKEEKKLGINATACCELVFNDCEVAVSNRIRNEREGYKEALSTLDGGRIG